MAWIVRYGEVEVSSDDFTVAELGDVEKVSGVPWSIANPLREAKVAKAFIATALSHAGWSEDEVVGAIESLTLKRMKAAFQYVPDVMGEDEEGEEGEDPTQSQSLTSPDSSTGDISADGFLPMSAASA